MENFNESVEGLLKCRRLWLREARQAKLIVAELPKAIQDLEVGTVDATIQNNSLAVTMFGGSKVIREFAKNGIKGFEIIFAEYDGSWRGRITHQLPSGATLNVTVYDADQPMMCEVETYQETMTVTKYRKVCQDLTDNEKTKVTKESL